MHVNLFKKMHLGALESNMKARTILLVIALVFVSVFASYAKAGELDDLLEGKVVEYNGTCRFDKNDMIIFESQENMKVVRCVVGFAPPDTDDLKYVLLFMNDKPVVLLEYSMVRKAQRVLWKRGNT